MKILVLIAILSSAIILFGPAAAQHTSDSARIKAVYPSKLELVIPMEEELQIQEASSGKDVKVSGNIIVRANVDWVLRVKGHYGGKMQKSTDTSVLLKNQMRIQYTGTTPLPSEVVLTNNYKIYRKGSPGINVIPTDFKQKFLWSDVPTEYRTRVWFEIAPD